MGEGAEPLGPTPPTPDSLCNLSNLQFGRIGVELAPPTWEIIPVNSDPSFDPNSIPALPVYDVSDIQTAVDATAVIRTSSIWSHRSSTT